MIDRGPRAPTQRQGQVLADIRYYGKVNGRPPSEADIERRLGTTWAPVHQMIVRLERLGFISRTPAMARSIKALLPSLE